MYVAGAEHPNRAPALAFLNDVRHGTIDACTSTEVLQEILHRYSAIGLRTMGCRVYDLFVDVVPQVLPVTLADTDVARNLLSESDTLSSRDVLHVAVMMNNDIGSVATFDEGFDHASQISRWIFSKN